MWRYIALGDRKIWWASKFPFGFRNLDFGIWCILVGHSDTQEMVKHTQRS